MACRLCLRPDLHVHESETLVSRVFIPPKLWGFRPAKVKRISFAPPAIKYRGRWWLMESELIEKLYPAWKQLRRLRPAPPPQDEQDPEDPEDEDD